MPAVMNAPEVVEHEEHALYAAHDPEQPPVCAASPGFWPRVLQYVQQRVHTSHSIPCSAHGPLHRIEMPADLLARQYPSLYIRAYAGV
jgi:hypothetical protein